jgi:hypothetical protein
MPDRHPIPPDIWRQLLALLRSVPEKCPDGAEIVLQVRGADGVVTAIRRQARIE